MTDETNNSQFGRLFRKIFGNDEFSGENLLRYTPHDLLWVMSEKWEIHSHWIESYLCGEFEKYTANHHLTEEKANLYNDCEEQIIKKINELAERLSCIVRCYWPEPIMDKSQESQAAPKDAIAEDLRARTLRCYQSLQGIAFSDFGPDSRVRTTFPPDEVLTRLGQGTEPMVAELESLAAKSDRKHEPGKSLSYKLNNVQHSDR